MTWSQSCFDIVWLRHSHTEHDLRTIFHSQLSQKSIKNLRWRFLLLLIKKQIFILTRFLHAKTIFNSDRRLYKKRWCDCWNKFSQLIDSWRSRDSIWLDATSLILFLERFETERICFWLTMLWNHRLSSVLWICKLNRLIRRSFFFWWSEFECRYAWFKRETENF